MAERIATAGGTFDPSRRGIYFMASGDLDSLTQAAASHRAILFQALAAGQPVFLVEGEKDVHTIESEEGVRRG